MTNNDEFIVKSFASLQDCLSYVQQQLAEEEFLFRGESTDRFCTTISALDRVLSNDTLLPECKEVIKECVQYVHVELQEFLQLSPSLAMGFLQHYEFPTRVFDFTSSICVAAYFAAQGKVDSAGLFAVIPRVLDPDLAEIQDLSKGSKAVRALRQSAFAVYSKKYRDLKSNDARAKLGIRWYRFTLTEQDRILYSGRDDLLNVCTDKVAGVLPLLVDRFGEMHDWSARWLADHVVVAPFVATFCERDETGRLIVELVSAKEAGIKFYETAERENNYRFWSNRYLDVRGRGGFKNLYRDGSLT